MADAKTFSILEVAQGRSYPTDTFPIYLDHDGAYHAALLKERIASEKDGTVADALKAELDELVQRVQGSAITVTLRGLSTETQEDIAKTVDAKFGAEVESDEKVIYRNNAFLAAHIAEIKNSDGAVDPTVWDAENIRDLLNAIPDEEAGKLLRKMVDLTFKAAYFEHVEVSSDF